MKFIKGIIYLLIVAVLVLLVTALFAPSFFINKYQDKIIAEVQKATGRAVSIGDISAHLIPNPKLKLSDVKVPSVEGSQFKNFVETDSLNVNLELWPLLSKTVEIRSLDLNGARIFAEQFADGRNNWTFDTKQQSTASTASAEASNNGASDINIVLQQGSLTNSQITYLDHKSNMQQQVSDINLKLRMDSLQGPFNTTGSLNWNNIPMTIALDTGNLTDAAFTVKGNIDVASSHKLGVDMAVQMASEKKDFQGSFNLNSPNIQALAGAFGAAASVPKAALVVSSPVAGNLDQINLDALSVKFLDTNINGSTSISLQGQRPKITTKLTGDQLSIDALLAAFPASEASKAKPKQQVQRTSPKPQDTVATNLMPVDLDINASLGALIYNQQRINDIAVNATIINDILAINSFNVRDFLGGSIALSGQTDIKNPQAAGISFDVNHPDISRLLAASGGSAELPKGARNIALKGKAGLAPSRFSVKDVSGTIGTSTLKNAQALVDLNGNVPYIETTSSWGVLDINSFTGEKASKPAAATNEQASSASSAPSTQKMDFSALGMLNGRFSVKADQVKYTPHLLTNMVLQASLQNKVLTVDSASFNAYNGTVSTSAVVDASGQAAKIQINPKVSNLSVGQFAKNFTKVKLPAGDFNMQAALTTSGQSSAEFAQNLNGNGDLAIGNVSSTSGDSQDFLNILQKLNSAVRGNASMLNLKAVFNAQNGVINLDPVTAEGVVSSTAKGYFDIPKQYVDVRGVMKLLDGGISKLLMAAISKPQDKEYPFAIYGPLSNITTELPSDLQQAVNLYQGVSSKDLTGILAGELGQKAMEKLGLSDSVINLLGSFSKGQKTESTQTLDDVLQGLGSGSGEQAVVSPKEVIKEQGKQKVQQETDKIIDKALGEDNPLGGVAKEILNQEAGNLLKKLF